MIRGRKWWRPHRDSASEYGAILSQLADREWDVTGARSSPVTLGAAAAAITRVSASRHEAELEKRAHAAHANHHRPKRAVAR